MHSLLRLAVVGGFTACVEGAIVRVPAPALTPAPTVEDVRRLAIRQGPDAVSLAQVLLTAIPATLRQVAATDLPAVSSMLWEEFLDDKRPEWFRELPEDIQSYLVTRFGPQTAWPSDSMASVGDGTVVASATTEEIGRTSDASTAAETDATHSTKDFMSTRPTDSAISTTLPPTTTSDPLSTLHSTLRLSKSVEPPLSKTSGAFITDPPSSSDSALSKRQKVGLGIGIPVAIVAAVAAVFGCCTILRRRRRRNLHGSVPPSSPGFIPRFAFQERSAENTEHRTPLNSYLNRSTQDLGGTDWDDEGVDPAEETSTPNPYTMYAMAPAETPNEKTLVHHSGPLHTDQGPYPPMMAQNPKPIMAPALYHTHSSNRARGKRTSYTSLHSVAEVAEPDESTPHPFTERETSSKHAYTRNLMHAPSIPPMAQIKRKPIATNPQLGPDTPPPIMTGPTAQAASPTPLRQTLQDHSGSSSSGLAFGASNGLNSSCSSMYGSHAELTSPVSPASERSHSNPFVYDIYIEDYGPEYHSGHVDIEDGLYGGHTSLSRYAEPRRKASKTEWPLRNIVGSGHRRKSSPLWDRIYEE